MFTTTLRTALTISALLTTALFTTTSHAQSGLQKIVVHGTSLEGNLEGDSADREVFVYLPPSYATDTNKRFPVIYFLHGYGVGAQRYVDGVLSLPDAADKTMGAGAEQAIIVAPDAYSVYGGSMYSNSPTTGDWESFISKDLVGYIDSHYRTLAKRESRGLSGHSMGGYGTLRVAMKNPELFGAIYAMSSCCLMNQAPNQEAVEAQIKRLAAGETKNAAGFANVLEAQAAAWAPNPQNKPYYFDWPFVNGAAQPQVQAKWIANSPLIMVDQNVPALQSFSGVMLDVGDKDTLLATNQQLDAALTRLNIKHTFEVYDGDHGNRVGLRFIEKVLPFFAQHLQEK
jgi:S-formylglutathione hydrolase FrmB